MKVHGVNEMLTSNTSGFARDGIRAIHPSEVTA